MHKAAGNLAISKMHEAAGKLAISGMRAKE